MVNAGGKIVIKLIGICGSRVKQGNMEAFLDEAMNQARQHQDVEADSIALWEGDQWLQPLQLVYQESVSRPALYPGR